MNTPCSTVDPEIFFDAHRRTEAKALCDLCPTKAFRRCRQDASERQDPHGVWGGETGAERIGRLIREAQVDGDIPERLWGLLIEATGNTTANQAALQAGLAAELVAAETSLPLSDKTYEMAPNGTTREAEEAEVRALKFVGAQRLAEIEAKKARCIELFNAGLSRKIIARKLGIGRNTIAKYLPATEGRQGNQYTETFAEEKAKAFKLFETDATNAFIAAATGISLRTIGRYRDQWRKENGRTRRPEVVIPAVTDREIPPMPPVKRPNYAPHLVVDLEVVWRLTHLGMSKSQIAAETGYSPAAIGRARRTLAAASDAARIGAAA